MRQRAFTLIELLVVVAIIALLVGVLLPALAEARRSAQVAVSLSNMRQSTVGMSLYGYENKDAFVNPFDMNMPRYYGLQWCNIVSRGSLNSGPGFVSFWAFDDSSYASEMFAAHWLSLMMDYFSPGQLQSRIQIAPSDKTVRDRFDAYLAGNSSLDNTIHDGSYFYSPTMWLSSERYKGTSLPKLNSDPISARFWHRNRYDEVLFPWAKVMIWERFDFVRKTRRGFAGGREKLFPQWNNPESVSRFGHVDGSVESVAISALNRLANDPSPAVQNIFTPSGGLWRVPTTTLSRYDMDKDGFENGQNMTRSYPAYFWATRGGIRGRDINK